MCNLRLPCPTQLSILPFSIALLYKSVLCESCSCRYQTIPYQYWCSRFRKSGCCFCSSWQPLYSEQIPETYISESFCKLRLHLVPKYFLRTSTSFLGCTYPNSVTPKEYTHCGFGEFGWCLWHLLPTIPDPSSLLITQTSQPYVTIGATIVQNRVEHTFILTPFLVIPTFVMAVKARLPLLTRSSVLGL